MDDYIAFDEQGYYPGSLPYKDMKPDAWYTTYVMYAERKWLLHNVGIRKSIWSYLKALTPISGNELGQMLYNADLQVDYRAFDNIGNTVDRDDMANIMVAAFSDKFPEYSYLYGNNIEIYKFLLYRLDSMSGSQQVTYVQRLIQKLAPLDHAMMGQNYNIHLDGLVTFLSTILVDFE